MKRIWLVKIGETLPVGKSKKRLLRTGLLAEILAKEGHEVIFWSSTFDHFNKERLFESDIDIQTDEGYSLRLIDGIPYKKNVSVARLLNHKQIANKFSKRINSDPNKPDIIVCSYPTVDLSYECVKFGKKYNIPVFLDIRDLWPDIFFRELLPEKLGLLNLRIFNILSRKHIYSLKNATGLIGITAKILQWGLDYAGRPKSEKDQVFHLSYNRIYKDCDPLALQELSNKGIIFDPSKIYVCLIGTISPFKFDFGPVLEAAVQLNKSKSDVKFLICGDGEGLLELKKKCSNLENIHFTGWINQEEINCIMMNSSIGLAPYHNSFTYLTSIPSKISEYFSYGLVVLSGLRGSLQEYLDENKAGYYYSSGEELREYLLLIENQRGMLQQFSENNQRLFEQNFKSSIVYNKFKNIILQNSN